MSALRKLQILGNQLELIERNSSSQKESTVSLDQIRSIRESLNALKHELTEELKYSHRYHESYRTHRPSTALSSNLGLTISCPSETESKSAQDNDDYDDETIAWLDDNYGPNAGGKSALVSPKRSPLQRFKVLSRVLQSEIKDCMKYGIEPKDMINDNLSQTSTIQQLAGWARKRMSVATPNASQGSLQNTNMTLALPEITNILDKCWNLEEFDIFELASRPEIHGHIMVTFGSYLAQQFSWLNSYHIPRDKFHNFLLEIENNYGEIPYHNKIHAVDVCHTMMHFCRSPIFTEHMTELDQLSAFLAAIIHDVGHTGQTNNYHINSRSVLAIRYNDRSCLENFHLATAFQILQNPENNFLEHLTKKEYRYVRESVIEMVLGTDLCFHQKQLKRLQQFVNIINRQNALDFQIFPPSGSGHSDDSDDAIQLIPRIRGVLNEKRFLMEVALHLSDISNPTKKLSVSIEWSKRITQEFFAQGEMERSLNLPISPGCDREKNGNMAKQALGFIDFIVYPMYNSYHMIDKNINAFIEGIKTTRTYWQSQL